MVQTTADTWAHSTGEDRRAGLRQALDRCPACEPESVDGMTDDEVLRALVDHRYRHGDWVNDVVQPHATALVVRLRELLGERNVTGCVGGGRVTVEIAMPAPLPTYVVTVLPGTWTPEQIADGARRFEAEARHGLAMAGVP